MVIKKNKLGVVDFVKNPFFYDPTKYSFQKELKGKGAKICIIGSGVPDHNDITNIEESISFIDADNKDNTNDSHGLSTIVGGILTSKNPKSVNGLCQESKLYFTKAIKNNGEISLKSVNASILWAIIKKVNIIIIPFEIEESNDDFSNIVKKAYSSNISIFSPKPKSNKEECILYVSSSNKDNETYCLNENYVSTFIGNKYIETSGSHYLAGLVGGLASLCIEENPKVSVNQIYHSLLNKN